jgi:hypothetical protein
MNEEVPRNSADPPEDIGGFVGMRETFDHLLFQEGDVFPVEPKIIL